MAEKRMISKAIVDSDIFLNMPSSTQNLYFHLSVRGDDEGFVNSPIKIMRVCGANQNDLDILLAKKYLIGFKSGVVVIKHWKLHNAIRKDRIKETNYVEEKQLLSVKKNGAYTLGCQSAAFCGIDNNIPPSSLVQDSLVQDSLVQDSIVECSIVEDSIVLTPIQELIEFYFKCKGINDRTYINQQFKAQLRFAKNLLDLTKNNLDLSFDVIKLGQSYFEQKNLDWSLSAICKHFPNLMKQETYISKNLKTLYAWGKKEGIC